MSTPLRERPDAPLGTLIFRAGLLPAETIENALEEGVKTGRRLGEILVERNLIKEEDLTRLLAGQKGLPFVSLRERSIEPDAARLLSEDQARLFTALPIGFEEGLPIVAVADPTNDVLNRNIREALGQEARFIVVARSELNDVIGEIFGGTYEAAAAAPEPEPQPLRVDTSVPAAEHELPAPEFEAEPEPALEADLSSRPPSSRPSRNRRSRPT
jgi:type IV pilus assembly protein PilB